jgi:hypothetical protein
MECFEAQGFRTLLRRAFVLNSTVWIRISSLIERRFHYLVLLASLFTFGLRGADYRRVITGDDATLVTHALDRQMPWGVLGRFDKLGLFDPFNDYLAVLLRFVTHFALIGPDSQFAFRVFVMMTIFWAVVTWVIALTVRSFVSPKAGVTAALALCWLPFSNQVLLAQINPVAWPLALLCILVVALRVYPEKLLYRIVLVVVFSLTAMSTGTMIIAIGWLVFDIARNTRVIYRFQAVLLFFTGISYYLQWITYEPRPNVKLPLGHELFRTLFSWSPQFIRSRVGQELSFGSTVILWLIPVLLLTAWLLLFASAYRSDRLRAIASMRLLITSLALPVLLILGNGWLNTHYLFIPASLFWISAIVLAFSKHACHKNILRLSATVLTVCYCSAISGVYYVL